ncbi:macrophage mannose receptor 1-like protein [Labeo rohita]|uniref:Macrophage mannose receptor 1-like protein n=1 Tax=Labeo rohita TaxID=84645 RepID=A0A498NXW7_LABRO|nr:macrophage mannose receptor 1-like protein [Labeo rohita]
MFPWTEAQSYCRYYYTDLVSVRNLEENNRIKVLIPLVKYAYIGLFSDNFVWSDGSMSSFRNWDWLQPDILGQCVSMVENKFWKTELCGKLKPFFCYHTGAAIKRQILRLEVKSGLNVNDPDVKKTILAEIQKNLLKLGATNITKLEWRAAADGTVFQKNERETRLLSLTLSDSEASEQQEYVLIQESMSWENAQTYCRTNHTDLATVQSNENWTRLQEAADEKAHSSFAWIGLYRNINNWCWSYEEESLVFQSWGSGYPVNDAYGKDCVGMYYDRTWFKLPLHRFILFCVLQWMKRQVIRVQVKSGQNVDEATLKALVLNEIHNLKQMLNNEDVTLTWRTQPNGKVFQKDKTVRKHSEANTTVCPSFK